MFDVSVFLAHNKNGTGSRHPFPFFRYKTANCARQAKNGSASDRGGCRLLARTPFRIITITLAILLCLGSPLPEAYKERKFHLKQHLTSGTVQNFVNHPRITYYLRMRGSSRHMRSLDMTHAR